MITNSIDHAIQCLQNEDVVGFPTETVYGLAGCINSKKAIKKIFEIKNRPAENPLIVHLASANDLSMVAKHIPDAAKKLAEKFWPGPLTLLLEKKKAVSDLITAGKNTVAVRVPNHPVALQLLRKIKEPLAAPSANPYTQISPTQSKHVYEYFGETIPLVLEGGVCKNGVESTIVGFEGNTVVLYRHGAISIEELTSVVGDVIVRSSVSENIITPGMQKKHYAPKTKVIITKNPGIWIAQNPQKQIGYIALRKYNPDLSRQYQIVLSWKGCLKEAASRLYASMIFLDSQGLDYILIKPFPNRGLGRTLNDRLSRAMFSPSEIIPKEVGLEQIEVDAV